MWSASSHVLEARLTRPGFTISLASSAWCVPWRGPFTCRPYFQPKQLHVCRLCIASRKRAQVSQLLPRLREGLSHGQHFVRGHARLLRLSSGVQLWSNQQHTPTARLFLLHGCVSGPINNMVRSQTSLMSHLRALYDVLRPHAGLMCHSCTVQCVPRLRSLASVWLDGATSQNGNNCCSSPRPFGSPRTGTVGTPQKTATPIQEEEVAATTAASDRALRRDT